MSQLPAAGTTQLRATSKWNTPPTTKTYGMALITLHPCQEPRELDEDARVLSLSILRITKFIRKRSVLGHNINGVPSMAEVGSFIWGLTPQ